MAHRCEICNKGALTGHNVSHSNTKTPKRSMPNLHPVRAIVNGGVKRIMVCSRCIRNGAVKKAA